MSVYNLTFTNGTSVVAGGVPEHTINSSALSIKLIGKNTGGYGEALNNNFIRLLENFSNTSAPTYPTRGQLWWDSQNTVLKVYNGANWKIISSSTAQSGAPTVAQSGDLWWNTDSSTLEVFSGTTWVPIGPYVSPAAPTTIFTGYGLIDGSPTPTARIVGNLIVNSTTVAIMSPLIGSFPLGVPLYGLSTINPGLNFVSTVEPSMISSPNMILGVTNSNIQITGTSNIGFNLTSNVNGTITNVLTISGNTGLATIYGSPINAQGIATKGYVDTANTNVVSYTTTANTRMKTYVDTANTNVVSFATTANTNMKTYVDTANTNVVSFATTSNTRMKTYVDTTVSNSVTTSNSSMKTYVDAKVASGIAGSDLTLNSITAISNNITIVGNITPTTTTTYNLGSADKQWNIVYGTSVSAQYADLAELYTSDQEYNPGTVVIFGQDTEVTISNQANDRRVAGIVTTNPAYLMNSTGSGIGIALQGRVPCNVIGTVMRGDMMVTSDIPGVAMVNNNPNPGTVLGKALSNYNSSEVGVIEVVVGRQ